MDAGRPGPSGPSVPAAEGVTTRRSPRSVAETVARVEELAETGGLKVFTVIDHSGEAVAAGLAFRDTKLIVLGSPVAGTPVMEAAPLAALDLPLKVLVWEEGPGTVWVSVNDPGWLARRHGLGPDLAARLAGLTGLVEAVVAP